MQEVYTIMCWFSYSYSHIIFTIVNIGCMTITVEEVVVELYITVM